MGSQGKLQYEHVIEYRYRFHPGFTSKKTFEEKLYIFFEHIRAKYNGEQTEEPMRQTDELHLDA